MLRTSEFILNFILNSCWQIAVIFAISAVGAWLLKNGPARYRHALWIVGLTACLVVPLLTATRFVPVWVSSFQIAAPSTPVTNVVANVRSEDLNVDHIVSSRRKTVTTSSSSVLILSLVYALLICGRGIRLARFWQRKEKLRKSASSTSIGPEVEVVAHRCSNLLNVKHVPVTSSTEARVPYTIGTLHPLIVLPQAFSGADEAGLLSVIGHEMAHVKRRDFLTNLLCELVALPIWFHPLTFLIKRQIDRTRELACDELVTKRVLAPKVYARSLLWAAHVSRQYSSQAFMLSIFDGKILEERIVRLMQNNRRVGGGPARVMMFALLAVLCASALSLSMFSLELQTQARAAVRQTIQTLNLPAAVQDPVTPTPAASQPHREAQLNAPAAEDRAMSACNAGREGNVDAIPSLVAMLGDDSKTQLITCWDSGRWSPALQTFKHPSPGEQAALALASMGRKTLGPLSQQLDSSNAIVRRNAAWAIGELTNMRPGERGGAVPQLITLLGDSDEWVRMAAARALGELRDERALTQLVATLADDNWRVRQVVVWALSEMKDDRAVTALCSVLLSDARVEVRRGAAEALGEIASGAAIPSLKQALNDADSSVSAKAAWAISEIEG
ncbi:MAG TPA: M56 family metallopeptidase [Pyrinomonadaceae bacterium]|nr:M56 family metallopeptidase [Pyrinomonadaceae bacterium]